MPFSYGTNLTVEFSKSQSQLQLILRLNAYTFYSYFSAHTTTLAFCGRMNVRECQMYVKRRPANAETSSAEDLAWARSGGNRSFSTDRRQ